MPLRGEATNQPTYLNLAPIAQGMSEIHRAHHAVFQRPVVQKTVPIRSLVPDAIAFLEPQLLKAVQHRAMPRIFEAQFDPQRPGHVTLVMESVGDHGADAIVLGQNPPLSVGETLVVGLELLSALEYLHTEMGVVHRDLKPDNILLSSDRTRAWLIDFNMAGKVQPNGKVAGVATPLAWMAPEVPRSGYSVAAEIFSLGVVLYELMLGRTLLEGSSLEKVERRLSQGQRGFPENYYRQWPSHTPRPLRTVLARAMNADPTRRWTSAGEMRSALGRLVLVDWQPGLPGASDWSGTWPTSKPDATRVSVRVSVRTLARGPSSGKRRATATYETPTGYRRISGLADRDISSDTELAQFFEDVVSALERLRPAS